MLDPRWRALGDGSAQGALLVALPSYDSVLLAHDCGAGSRAALAAMAGQLASGSPAPLFTTVLRVTATGLERLTP